VELKCSEVQLPRRVLEFLPQCLRERTVNLSVCSGCGTLLAPSHAPQAGGADEATKTPHPASSAPCGPSRGSWTNQTSLSCRVGQRSIREGLTSHLPRARSLRASKTCSQAARLGMEDGQNGVEVLLEDRSTRNGMSWRLIAGVLGSHFQGPASPHFRPNSIHPGACLHWCLPRGLHLSALLCPTIV
jgi:hypothetical protein